MSKQESKFVFILPCPCSKVVVCESGRNSMSQDTEVHYRTNQLWSLNFGWRQMQSVLCCHFTDCWSPLKTDILSIFCCLKQNIQLQIPPELLPCLSSQFWVVKHKYILQFTSLFFLYSDLYFTCCKLVLSNIIFFIRPTPQNQTDFSRFIVCIKMKVYGV